jgi:hypothetical protein
MAVAPALDDRWRLFRLYAPQPLPLLTQNLPPDQPLRQMVFTPSGLRAMFLLCTPPRSQGRPHILRLPG